MKIVITGASSGLGAEFVRQVPEALSVRLRYNDYASYKKLTTCLGDSDAVVVHFGALVHSDDMHKLLEANVCLVQDLLDIAHRAPGNVKVILISSMSVLGKDNQLKPTQHMTNYTLSKYMMEQVASNFKHNPPLVIRFSTLFYKDPFKDGLSKIVYDLKIKNEARVVECWRDFISIHQACSLLVQLCDDVDRVFDGQVLNLGSGKSYNLLMLAQSLAFKTGGVVHELPKTNSDVCFMFPTSAFYRLSGGDFDFQELVDFYISLGE